MTEERHIHITSGHRLFDLKLREVWQYRDLILLFTRRNFSVRYKQTILGPLWLFINPLLTSGIYVLLFGNIAKLGTDGVPQLLFYLSGNAVWSYFSKCVGDNSRTFTDNARVFGKVYFPRLSVPVSNVLSTMLRFWIQMILVLVLLVWYAIRGMVFVSPLAVVVIPLVLVWLGLLGMSCGIIVSSLTTRYRDLAVLVDFGLSLWMYGTPVVYPLSTTASMPLIRTLVLLNPVTMPVELFRRVLLGTGTILPGYLCLSLLLTALLLLAGIVLFNRVERTFMDTV